MMIKLLPMSEYKGYELRFAYQTDSHFRVTRQVSEDEISFRLTRERFDKPVDKRFTDKLYADHLASPEAYGWFEEEAWAGVLEINHETWSNRLRITELIVFEKHRRQGIAMRLVDYAKDRARALGARQIVLETQTCNVPALGFYFAAGFTPVGLDTSCYKNDDIERGEVRVELGLLL